MVLPSLPRKSLLKCVSISRGIFAAFSHAHTHLYRQAHKEVGKKAKEKDEASEESTESSSEDEKPAAKHLVTNGKVRSAIYLSLELN
jgi:hypothetical protein